MKQTWGAMIVVLVLLGAIPSAVQAGLSGAILDEQGFSDEAQNAADAFQNSATAYATSGNTARGASGPLGEIALNSGELICNTWIIAARLEIQRLSLRALRAEGDEYVRLAQMLRDLRALADIIELECTRKGLIGDTPEEDITSGNGGTATSPEEEEDTYEPPPRRPGDTVADSICRRRCSSLYWAMQRAEREAEETAETAQERRQRASNLERSLEQLRSTLREARNELEALMEQGRPVLEGSPTEAEIQEAIDYNQSLAHVERIIEELQDQEEDLEEDVEEAQHNAENWERWAARDEARAEEARQAYYNCLKACIKQATDAGDEVTIGDEIPERYLESERQEKGSRKSSVGGKGKPRIKLESVRPQGETNPFDSRSIREMGEPKDHKTVAPVMQPAPKVPAKVTAPAEPVSQQPQEEAPSPPVAPALPPLAVSVSGTVSFAHTVGGSPCPQPAGTVNVSSNHPGHALQVSSVSASGAIASKLNTSVQGNGSPNPQVVAQFNCSSPANGTFGGAVTGTVTDTVTGESQPFSIPASGSVSGG